MRTTNNCSVCRFIAFNKFGMLKWVECTFYFTFSKGLGFLFCFVFSSSQIWQFYRRLKIMASRSNCIPMHIIIYVCIWTIVIRIWYYSLITTCRTYAHTHTLTQSIYLEDYGSLANLWIENFHKFDDFIFCSYIFISCFADAKHGFRRGTIYILLASSLCVCACLCLCVFFFWFLFMRVVDDFVYLKQIVCRKIERMHIFFVSHSTMFVYNAQCTHIIIYTEWISSHHRYLH